MPPGFMVGSRLQQLGGIAFIFGNLLFLANKFSDMSRLFLGRRIPDLISGENPLLILVGQVALIIGFALYYQFYAPRAGRVGKVALGVFAGGGIMLALGHVSFMTRLMRSLPDEIGVYLEYLFLLVAFGSLLVLVGLLWFGVLSLRQPILGSCVWLPLMTGLMGLGFALFSGEDITVAFLFFRTLFALGLIGLGVVFWQEKPLSPAAV